ncbi:uncharacterized protein LOC116424402 [Nomia melanderi]|uniref:uncharacterized protein LOC116424402 n=1 Tax=Nomia melanderi TaxID=2448451 RepID=UPI003FCE29F8
MHLNPHTITRKRTVGEEKREKQTEQVEIAHRCRSIDFARSRVITHRGHRKGKVIRGEAEGQPLEQFPEAISKRQPETDSIEGNMIYERSKNYVTENHGTGIVLT